MENERTVHPFDDTPFDTDQVDRLIRGRRTVKPPLFNDETIPSEVIETILENANWAPTHGMTEPWRFVVYAGEARAGLAEILPRIYGEITPEAEQRPEKFEKLKANPLAASHTIALLMKRHEGKIPELEEIEAVACAVQNMALTAFAHGLGSFWSTGAMIYTPEAHHALGLEEDEKLLGFLYLGYPRKAFPKGVRASVSAKVRWAQ